MDERKLTKFWEIIQEAKERIKELDSDLDFTIDLFIQALDYSHPLAIEARMLNWKPGRQDDSAWYTKSDEYVNISVFIE